MKNNLIKKEDTEYKCGIAGYNKHNLRKDTKVDNYKIHKCIEKIIFGTKVMYKYTLEVPKGRLSCDEINCIINEIQKEHTLPLWLVADYPGSSNFPEHFEEEILRDKVSRCDLYCCNGGIKRDECHKDENSYLNNKVKEIYKNLKLNQQIRK